MISKKLEFYRGKINPPYTKKDLPYILGTIFIFLCIPATVLLVFTGLRLGSFAAIRTNIWLEAENGTISAPINISNDNGASNNKYVSSSVSNIALNGSSLPLLHQHSSHVLQAQAWGFEDTFDLGAPASPQPFSSPRWDIVVDSNDADAIMDGQVVGPNDTSLFPPIEAGHGSGCQPPLNPANSNDPNNNHLIDVDFSSELAFQKNTRPHLAFICNNHMMTVAKAGYGAISMMPRYIFDWSGRTGTIEFETSLYTRGEREWWDIYITPPGEDSLQNVVQGDGGNYESYPKRGVRFSLKANRARALMIDNYQVVGGEYNYWQEFRQAFPNDPANSDPKIRRKVRIEMSNTSWKFEIQKQDGTFWTHTGSWAQPLSFTQGLVRWEQHAYNPTKDGIFGSPWSQFTYHWDNMRFDGPTIQAHTAFEAPAHFVKLDGEPGANKISESVKINVNVPSASNIKNPVLYGHIYAGLNHSFFTNKPHPGTSGGGDDWRQFRINGGPWKNLWLLKDSNINLGACCRTWSTIRNPLSASDLRVGDNTIEFRRPFNPGSAPAETNIFRIKDLELRIDALGVVSPPPPADTTPPVVSLTAPTTGATVSGNLVIRANASDTGSGINHVMFMINGASIGEDFTAPYEVSWNSSTVCDKQNTISAHAVDNAGNNFMSDVTVNTSNSNPCLPTNTGSSALPFSISEGGDFTVWTRIFATDASSDSYWLQVDNLPAVKVGDGGVSYGSWRWVNHKDSSTTNKISFNLTVGTHLLKIIGREANTKIDKLLISNDLTFTPTGLSGDEQSPVVSIISPANNTSVVGAIKVNISATDNDSVSKVELFTDGNISGSSTSLVGGIYEINLDTAGFSNGNHKILAKATDNLGNIGNSAETTIVIANTTTPIPKEGDLNGDNQVNILDLSVLLSNWSSANLTADVNKDGIISILDLSILLSKWGT